MKGGLTLEAGAITLPTTISIPTTNQLGYSFSGTLTTGLRNLHRTNRVFWPSAANCQECTAKHHSSENLSTFRLEIDARVKIVSPPTRVRSLAQDRNLLTLG